MVPMDSEIYMAFQTIPRIQQTARFNPWSLILELLDDPRLLFNEKRRNRLLSAVSQLGWINTQNVLAQRPLFAYHLLKNRCFTLAPKYSSMQTNPETEVDTENERSQIAQLSPAQSITLHQIQWPHYIANKYEALASLSASKNRRDSAEWDRIWLCTNTCMEELRTAYIKNRVVFNLRTSVEEQLQRLIRGSFDHAPGLVLNAIMSWNDDQYAILNPYVKQRLLSIYFANRETTKQTVVQAWQMYDWLLYSNSKFVMPAACIDYKGKLDSRSLTRSLLYRSLNSFDNWDEATHSLERLSCRWDSKSEQHPETQQTASDRKLVDKYFNMRMQLPMTRLIK
ncbi:hypothetical protein H4R99_002932 [Coemansia sp. RSA 1722]|nr:hypothetical protein IWW45_002305 [Coemansia sp. RSA 485]KAJ2601682.1 hypothetical protein H4R99_002932 [Coemansia sp. RSA 1722]